MAEFKRQTFFFSSGKELKLYGTGFGITKSLAIGEAFAPNIFFLHEDQEKGKPVASVSNIHKLTIEELHELAEYNIRQWLDFKDSIRKYGIDDPRLFNRENTRASDDYKQGAVPKKENKTQSERKENNNNKAGKSEQHGNAGTSDI